MRRSAGRNGSASSSTAGAIAYLTSTVPPHARPHSSAWRGAPPARKRSAPYNPDTSPSASSGSVRKLFAYTHSGVARQVASVQNSAPLGAAPTSRNTRNRIAASAPPANAFSSDVTARVTSSRFTGANGSAAARPSA